MFTLNNLCGLIQSVEMSQEQNWSLPEEENISLVNSSFSPYLNLQTAPSDSLLYKFQTFVALTNHIKQVFKKYLVMCIPYWFSFSMWDWTDTLCFLKCRKLHWNPTTSYCKLRYSSLAVLILNTHINRQSLKHGYTLYIFFEKNECYYRV